MEATDALFQGNKSRLYVGGLGPSVTSSDLERTFAALGRVSAVDMVRTKGRNFAYLNFEAASPHDLQRFFSLYNGCMWKGGRLKLERAREHYLDKLQREWADRDCSSDPSETSTSTSDSPSLTNKFSRLETSKGLKIFFPKLRKVKMVPQKGIGNNKRSFEHVDSIPYSFLELCDCKQCSRTSLFDQNKSMLEKLELAGKRDRKGWMKTHAKESNSTDTNGFKGPSRNYKMDSPKTKKQMIFFDTHNNTAEGTAELNEPYLKVTAKAERNSCNVIENFNNSKKEMQKSVMKAIADIPPKKCVSNLGIRGKESSKKHELKKSEEGKVQADLATAPSVENKELKSAVDRVWLQKASWKTLVGETDRISFRLSEILGQSLNSTPASTNRRDDGNSFTGKSACTFPSQQHVPMVSELKPESAKMSSESISKSEAQKTSVATCQSSIAGSKCHESTDLIRKSSPWIQDDPEGIFKQLGEGTLEQYELEFRKPTNIRETLSMGNNNDKVCTFMRSPNSEQEWFESKRIVKEMMKRNRKDALRTIKILQTPRQNY